MKKKFTKEEQEKGREVYREKQYQEFLNNPDRLYASEVIRNNLIYSGRKIECEECLITDIYNGKSIVLEVDHKDGNRYNNQLSNLRFLCYNCHSQTLTFRGRNVKGQGKIKVNDKELIKSLESSANIRQALYKVGLTPAGGNYERCRELQSRMPY
jgi:5-methylcytosine-specific restriction endonuclease McrA